MADNRTRGRSADRKRLNKSEPYEVAYAKSERASPQRKAMLAKGQSGSAGRSSGNGGAQKSGAKSGAKRAAKGAAKKSSTSGARKSASSVARKSAAGARKSASSSGARKSATGSARKSASGARKASSARGAATSASPAMKRTNSGAARRPTPSTRGTPHPPKEEKTVENTAPKTMRDPDAVDLLTDDHLEVSTLFKRYEKLADKKASGDDRRELANRICEMLKAHTRIEEEIFYPAARSAGIEGDMLDEAKVEHASAKDLIAQIEGGDPDDDLYDAKVTVLREYIQHHVVEEHSEMFPQCRRAGMDLVALRGELEARKASILPAAAAAEADTAKEEPGLLSRLSGKLFSSDDKSEGSDRA